MNVTNGNHENPADHQYIVSIDDVTNELMACTCPHHVHRNAFCKHMAAVENATDDAEPETATVRVSVASHAGRACGRDEQNCRTNHCFSLFFQSYAS
ncbi:hypothetical protein [Haladaptatus sp. CMAA 1911]|uniref:hypothetical protein n=1 Tax=unclassified Haladaptatus TaxID=2622732 RepID=UPI0037543CF0